MRAQMLESSSKLDVVQLLTWLDILLLNTMAMMEASTEVMTFQEPVHLLLVASLSSIIHPMVFRTADPMD